MQTTLEHKLYICWEDHNIQFYSQGPLLLAAQDE